MRAASVQATVPMLWCWWPVLSPGQASNKPRATHATALLRGLYGALALFLIPARVMSCSAQVNNAFRTPCKLSGASGGQCDVVAEVLRESQTYLDTLSQISDQTGALQRSFMSPAHRAAAAQLETWMLDAGLVSWVDAIGNVHGEMLASRSDVDTLVVASHYDTVADAGAYDGALGVLTGIAAAKALVLGLLADQNWTESDIPVRDGIRSLRGWVDRPALQRRARCNVRIIAFCDEEGLRFQAPFLGSRALLGLKKLFDVRHGLCCPQPVSFRTGDLTTSALEIRDAHGATLRDAFVPPGQDAAAVLAPLVLPPSSIAGYIEVHIEQGPVLQEMGQALGVVSSIVAQSRLLVTVHGEQGHAGTVPMQLRKDPMVGAAQLVTDLSRHCTAHGMPSLIARIASAVDGRLSGLSLWRKFRDEVARLVPTTDSGAAYLVCTVGQVVAWPGASNVIPGSVNVTVDVRSSDARVLEATTAWLRTRVASLCERRGYTCNVNQVFTTGSVPMDPDLRDGLARAIRTTGGLESNDPVPILTSGAGHDAMAIGTRCPAAMMFVRCRDGISHSPAEFVSQSDVQAATQALHAFLASFVKK